MNTQPTPNTTTSLEPVLRRLRSRVRRILFTRGMLITVVTALLGLMTLAALDFLFAPIPAAIRWGLPVLWLAAVVFAAITTWWMPMRKRLDLVRIARWLETRHPDLDERISTVLEVSHHPDHGMSSSLIDELAREAANSLESIDPAVEVSNRRVWPWLWPALALTVLWAALFALWPDRTSRHLVRALVPNSELGTASGVIVVSPGTIELIEGDLLKITAVHDDGLDTPLELIVHLADGTSTAMPMETSAEGSVHLFGGVDISFEYQVRRGRETSDRFKVTVWPEPRLVDPRVRLEFPAYTGWAAREQALGDGITAITGTRVSLQSKLNTPVDRIRLEIDQQDAGNTTLNRAADGGSMVSEWTLEKSGRSNARLIASHRLDREFELAAFSIKSEGDAPPEVKWLGSTKKNLRLRRDDNLKWNYQITDDVGLGTVALEVEPAGSGTERIGQEMPPRMGGSKKPVWQGRLEQPIGGLVSKWPKSKSFKLRMRVEDSRPSGLAGPGVGTSEWRVIRIDDGAESLARQDLFAAHSDVRETLQKSKDQVRQAREKIDRNRDEIRKAESNKQSQKELAEAREQLAEAAENLEQLAERMQESVHADKVDEVLKTAETIEQAREKLENAPLQDTSEQRAENAAEARKMAEEAQRQLETLQSETQQDESRVKDLAKLKDLEQKQRELARQADEAIADDPQQLPADPPEPWQKQQDQVAAELRQATQQQPDAKVASLEQQAEQAKQLAEEAREQAADQKAMQSPGEDSPSEDGLGEQMAKEQSELAAEATRQLAEARERQDHETANALPEAIESAQDAAKALTEDKDPATAAAEAKQAASQLAEAAESAAANEPSEPGEPSASAQASADLSDLAERQENLAEAISELEQGSLDEAAAKLSEMQAADATALAEEIRETPQVNGASSAMQQAAQSSDQAADQVRQAAGAESKGETGEASAAHQQAAKKFEQAATQLERAANEFARQAAQAAKKKPSKHLAPVPGQELAEAFQQASKASDANSQADAASHARAAAEALAQASQMAMSAMQGKKPGPPNPGQPGPPGESGDQIGDSELRSPEADQGVPPELAKLGMSMSDWEKIKASLSSEVGGSSGVALPEEYRSLVRSYFEEMSKSSSVISDQ